MTGKTRAEEIAEKARRLAEAKAAASSETAPHASSATSPLVKPVRSTVDLSPAVHRDFQNWLNEAAVRLGRSRLTKQDVIKALVGRLLHDEPLARLILADLQERQ